MILYTETPKDATKKLLELIDEFSKVAGYKINIQKSVARLCTNYKLSESEIKKTIPFTITSKRIKYLGINLTKELKDLYSENYKTLMKEMKDNTTCNLLFFFDLRYSHRLMCGLSSFIFTGE